MDAGRVTIKTVADELGVSVCAVNIRKIIPALFAIAVLISGVNVTAGVLISDDFEREYDNLHGSVGTTKEGYKWTRRDLDKNGVDIYCPGIFEYKEGNKGLVWKCPSMTTDIVSIDKKLKDFKLEFDYSFTGKSSSLLALNFRMPSLGGAVSDGGKSGGYALQISPLIQDGTKLKLLKFKLFSNYGLAKESTEIRTEEVGGHISIIMKGNNIKVYVSETLALDITDITENPSKEKEGYFSIQIKTYVSGEHCIDNWLVTTTE